MNKIYETYEKIQLTDQDKERLFHQLTEEKTMKKRILPYMIIFTTCCLLLLAIPYVVHSTQIAPSIQEQQSNTYKVNVNDYQGTIDNQEGLHQFIKDYQSNKKATLVVTHTTREGDPIITTVQYSKDNVIIINDSTQDRYSELPSIKKIQYKHLGIFNDDLCAYNDDLSLEALDNGEAYYIITLIYNGNENFSQ